MRASFFPPVRYPKVEQKRHPTIDSLNHNPLTWQNFSEKHLYDATVKTSRRSLKGGRRRELPYVFSPDKRLVQVVVKMKDTPRAYATLLELLGSRINLIETVTYSVEDGAIFSGFAEAQFPTERAEELRKLIAESPVVLDCVVIESSNGVLVDTFHKGLETSTGEPLVMFRRNGMARMFDVIARLSGKEVEGLLFNEGVAVGESDGSEILKTWKPGFMAEGFTTLVSLFSAFGWGNATSMDRSDPGKVRISMDDCFECSPAREENRSCSFIRGFMVGSARTLLGRGVSCEEPVCRFKGDDHCEFVLDVGGTDLSSNWAVK
jgi:predicted hydrocarbon binding protein